MVVVLCRPIAIGEVEVRRCLTETGPYQQHELAAYSRHARKRARTGSSTYVTDPGACLGYKAWDGVRRARAQQLPM